MRRSNSYRTVLSDKLSTNYLQMEIIFIQLIRKKIDAA